MFPAQPVGMAMQSLTDVRRHYALPEEVWDVLHPADRRPGQRLETFGQPASTCDRCCPGTCTPTRWHSADSSPSISCGIGLQPHPANLAHCSWGRLGAMDRNLSLWEQRASTRTCTSSPSITRPEAEDDECARSRGRWRLQRGRGGDESKVVPELPAGDGRLAYGRGRALYRTTLGPPSSHQHTRHSPLHGLCHLRSLWPEGGKSIEVSDTRPDGQRLHDQGATRAGIICPVACMLSGTSNFPDHAGRGGPFESTLLRDADRKAHTPLPFSLASDLLGRRIGQECTLKQDPFKSEDGGKGWETTATYMGSSSPLGLRLRHVGSGCGVFGKPKSTGLHWCGWQQGQRASRGPLQNKWQPNAFKEVWMPSHRHWSPIATKGHLQVLGPTDSPPGRRTQARREARKRKAAAVKEELAQLRASRSSQDKRGNPNSKQKCYSWNNGNSPCGDLQPGQACVAKIAREHKCTICDSPGHPSRSCPNKKKG